MHIIKYIILLGLAGLPIVSSADFQIKELCESDSEITSHTGKKHKFYAAMLAFNNEPPRCLRSNPIIDNTTTLEAELSNHEQTNDIIVNILLTESGKKLFSKYTTENPNAEIALVVDDKILTMLTLIQPINDGVIQIHGLWYEDSIRLSNAINLK